MQSVVWNEAVKINGADPDFHRRDLWDAIQSGDFPEWELGFQLFDDDFADSVRLRRARRDQDHPRGARADPARRPARARPRRRQLLRGDRTGRVLHAEHRPRRRLHERSAAAGPQLLVPRHAAEAARQPELHAPPGQRAEVPVRDVPTGRPHGDRSTRRRARTTSPTPGNPRSAARARIRSTGSRRTRRTNPARSSGFGPRPSPTTTARRASST